MTLDLKGRIDSKNAKQVEEELFASLQGNESENIVLNASELEYISSAGLRIILRLKKICSGLRMINVNPDVYEILDITGFTEMMQVEKACRMVSVEGCEVIGEGCNGKTYRIDDDNIVKVHKNHDSLSEIKHEREVARLALILGVPTVIPYDVVKVEDCFGSVFEICDAKSFASILAEDPDKMDWCVEEIVDTAKRIHGISVPAGKLPSIKSRTLKAVKRIKHVLPQGLVDKLERMIGDIPDANHMVHGNLLTNNIVYAGDEVLVIDMATLSVGDPIFELAHMYSGLCECKPEDIVQSQGFDADTAQQLWNKILCAYLGTDRDKVVSRVLDKIRCIAYSGLIDRKTRHIDQESEDDKAVLSLWTKELAELLEHVDTLSIEWQHFRDSTMGELEIDALTENLPQVTEFVETQLDALGCPTKTQMQIGVAVEEIFVNIASYAYGDQTGKAIVRVGLEDNKMATITFVDRGIPYDPTLEEDPNVKASVEERKIGGLGIFLTKKLMDNVAYIHEDGMNILTLKKKL